MEREADAAAAREAAERAGLDVAEIDGRRVATKRAFLSAAARALAFPPGLGRNWDALEDALRDLSWRTGRGTVLAWAPVDPLAEADPESFQVALDVLEEAAAWSGRKGRPLLVLLGGKRPPARRGSR
jgi:8-oxo-dGTP pyrophosphatase MutT (NUDIX family)